MTELTGNNWKVTVDNFKANFTELTGLTDTEIERILYQALQLHKHSPQATQYCAAHLYVLLKKSEAANDPIDGGGGEVAKDQIGAQVQEYRVMAEKGREVFFSTTSYGRHFLTLEKRTPQYVFGGVFIGK